MASRPFACAALSSQLRTAASALPPQFGSNPYDCRGRNYDRNAALGRRTSLTSHIPTPVWLQRLRPKRGNPAAKYNGSSAVSRKSLRRQKSEIYDDKKIGNI
jgi:hypothetical protein